jgi:hypothetical protein
MFVVLGSKVPAPPLHTPPVATVKDPFKVTTALFAQTVRSVPAFAVGSRRDGEGHLIAYRIAIAVAHGGERQALPYQQCVPQRSACTPH